MKMRRLGLGARVANEIADRFRMTAEERMVVREIVERVEEGTYVVPPQPPPPAPSDAEEVYKRVREWILNERHGPTMESRGGQKSVEIIAAALSSRARAALERGIEECEAVPTHVRYEASEPRDPSHVKHEILSALRRLRDEVRP